MLEMKSERPKLFRVIMFPHICDVCRKTIENEMFVVSDYVPSSDQKYFKAIVRSDYTTIYYGHFTEDNLGHDIILPPTARIQCAYCEVLEEVLR